MFNEIDCLWDGCRGGKKMARHTGRNWALLGGNALSLTPRLSCGRQDPSQASRQLQPIVRDSLLKSVIRSFTRIF